MELVGSDLLIYSWESLGEHFFPLNANSAQAGRTLLKLGWTSSAWGGPFRPGVDLFGCWQELLTLQQMTVREAREQEDRVRFSAIHGPASIAEPAGAV